MTGHTVLPKEVFMFYKILFLYLTGLGEDVFHPLETHLETWNCQPQAALQRVIFLF